MSATIGRRNEPHMLASYEICLERLRPLQQNAQMLSQIIQELNARTFGRLAAPNENTHHHVQNAKQIVANILQEFAQHIELIYNGPLQTARHHHKSRMWGQHYRTEFNEYETPAKLFQILSKVWCALPHAINTLAAHQAINIEHEKNLREQCHSLLSMLMQRLVSKSMIIREYRHDNEHETLQSRKDANKSLIIDPPLVVYKKTKKFALKVTHLCATDALMEYILTDQWSTTLNLITSDEKRKRQFRDDQETIVALPESVAQTLVRGEVSADGWLISQRYKVGSDSHRNGRSVLLKKEVESTPIAKFKKTTTDCFSFPALIIKSKVSESEEKKNRAVPKFTAYHFQAVSTCALSRNELDRKLRDGSPAWPTRHFTLSTISYPFMISVGALLQYKKQYPHMFWCALNSHLSSISCCEPDQNADQEAMSWTDLGRGLAHLFHKMTDSRKLHAVELQHIGNRLITGTIAADTEITLEQCEKRNLRHTSDKNCERDFTFFDWIYSAARLIQDRKGTAGKRPGKKAEPAKRYMRNMHQSGVIQGFVSDAETSHMLINCLLKSPNQQSHGMVLRFSDNTECAIALSCLQNGSKGKPEDMLKIGPFTRTVIEKFSLARLLLIMKQVDHVQYFCAGNDRKMPELLFKENVTGKKSKEKNIDPRYLLAVLEQIGFDEMGAQKTKGKGSDSAAGNEHSETDEEDEMENDNREMDVNAPSAAPSTPQTVDDSLAQNTRTRNDSSHAQHSYQHLNPASHQSIDSGMGGMESPHATHNVMTELNSKLESMTVEQQSQIMEMINQLEHSNLANTVAPTLQSPPAYRPTNYQQQFANHAMQNTQQPPMMSGYPIQQQYQQVGAKRARPSPSQPSPQLFEPNNSQRSPSGCACEEPYNITDLDSYLAANNRDVVYNPTYEGRPQLQPMASCPIQPAYSQLVNGAGPSSSHVPSTSGFMGYGALQHFPPAGQLHGDPVTHGREPSSETGTPPSEPELHTTTYFTEMDQSHSPASVEDETREHAIDGIMSFLKTD